MSTKKILMVVNPISGDIDKDPYIDHVAHKLQQQNDDLKIFTTSGKRDKEELRELVQSFKPDRMLSVGGDGTIKLIAEILKSDKIPIGIYPAGSANGLAENLDLPDDIEKLTEIALSDNFVFLDTITINHELCLHISDVGLNAELIRNYEEGKVRGKLGYVIQSIPTLIKSDFPFDFKIEQEGRTIHRKAVLLGIANARKYGTGSMINPRGKYDDGKFEILVFKKLDMTEILKTFWNADDLDEDFIEIFSSSRAKIECSRNVPFQIDGEYRGEVRSIEAEISPVKVKIAVPEKKNLHFR